MKFQVVVVLACLFSLTLVQYIRCGEHSDTSRGNKWTCTCSSAFKGSQSFAALANCASSCDCSPGSRKGKWQCICAADRLPKVSADAHDTSCFTSCDCRSGAATEAESTKKLLSSKVIVIVLLLCVVLTTVVFIPTIIFYVYRRKKCTIERTLFLSDKETSCNSASNLISHRASSVTDFKYCISSPARPIAGYIQKASVLFKNRTGTLHGTLINFSYAELENATNKFNHANLIGVGGSSHVYCGHLKNGEVVAVKRMKALGGSDVQRGILAEIELISRLHHCHVVPLLGFCLENQGKHGERLLVFEYMPNGNLREYLDRSSGKCLDWGTRVAIALGAAKGLEYLHEAAAPRILHRDVKSTNILLDENWRAKIADLGMAKRLRKDGMPSCSNSPARMQGTFGYFAPEYAIVGRASLKSDVFSFGVVLLELITGRHPIHKSDEKEESLVIWAIPRLQDSSRVILELPDPHLQGKFPEEELQIMAYLAKECLLLDPDSRPTMSEVVQILSTIDPVKSHRRNISFTLFQSSSSPDICHDLAIKILEQETQATVAQEEEHQVLSTSNTISLEYEDNEAVNLTEPEFEFFCVSNPESHL